MKLFGPLFRAVALAGLLLGGATATSTMAAPADVALLKQYVAVWKGNGTLSGAYTDSVNCKMSVVGGKGEKVNYAGRCSVAGASLSVNGTIAYVDAQKRYEAAMTSNVGFSGVAIGQKQGDGIVFNLRETNKDTSGNDVTVNASITLSGGKIVVNFGAVNNKTSEKTNAVIPFTKS